MDGSRWEHGSDFHLSLESGTWRTAWQGKPHGLWGSGRDAMRALLAWGRERHGWKRLFVPTFFCQDALRTVARELPIELYNDATDKPPPAHVEADPTDVLLLVNFYGMRSNPQIESRAIVLEDHTHDPLSQWAFASEADYAVASLRKTLPLPDGGVLWSPKGKGLPCERPASGAHCRVTLDRLSAMALKLLYLEGGTVDKAAFRAQFVAGERGIGEGELSGISPFSRARLLSLPAQRWREARANNLEVFRRGIADVPRLRMLDAPFAATLLFESHHLRECVRAALIAERVYPAVLWSLEAPVVSGIPAHHLEMSRRLLTLHCDFRYSREDMARVAQLVRATTLRSDAA